MKHILLILTVLASCTDPTAKPLCGARCDVDAGVPEVDGAGDGLGTDGSIDSDNSPDAPLPPDTSTAICSSMGDGSYTAQCCPAFSNCQAGLECYFNWDNTTPAQERSQCLAYPSGPGPGEACDLNENCSGGLFCDKFATFQPQGHCRELCVPGSQDNGCSGSQTCHPMQVCDAVQCVDYPDAEIGFCS